MHQELNHSQLPPFFDVLSAADEIQVREISPSLEIDNENIIKDLLVEMGQRTSFSQKSFSNQRAFIVFVKPSKVTGPAKAGRLKNFESTAPASFSREHLIESADLLLNNRDYLLARNIYSFLLKQDIRDADALKGLGICFLRLGDAVAARKCFRAFYELYKEETGLFWLGVSEASAGEDRQAAEYFGSIKRPQFFKKELYFEFLKESGNVYMRLSELEKAQMAYNSALLLEPNSDIIFVNLGTLSVQQKRFEIAHTYFMKALSLNMKNARAYCGLGIVALELGKKAYADIQFEKALELDPKNLVALSQMMKNADDENKVKTLKEKAELFLEKDRGNPDAKYLHAICEFKLGRYLTCQKEIELLLKETPSHELALRLRDELVKHVKTLGGL